MKKGIVDPWESRKKLGKRSDDSFKVTASFGNGGSRKHPPMDGSRPVKTFVQPQTANQFSLLYRRGSQQSDDLNVFATAVPTGLHPYTPSVPRVPLPHQRVGSEPRTNIRELHPPPINKTRSFTDESSRLSVLKSSLPKISAEILPPIVTVRALQESSATSESDSHDTSISGDCSNDEEFTSASDYEDVDDNESLNEYPDVEKGFPLLSECPMPILSEPNALFEATVIQEHHYFDLEKFAASADPSGINIRVDNLVRAFEIRGPLNKNILERALNAVARLHPILTARFYKRKSKLYLQVKPEEANVKLETPTFSAERARDAVLSAQRMVFAIPIVELEPGEDYLPNNFSLESPNDDYVLSKSSQQKLSKEQQGLPKLAQRVQVDKQFPGLRQEEGNFQTFMHAKVLSKSSQEHHLILSFPQIIADFWSTCLFMQQLSDAYSQLDKAIGNLGLNKTITPNPHSSRRSLATSHGQRGSPYSRPAGLGVSGYSDTSRGIPLGRIPIGGPNRFPRISSARPKTGKLKAGSMVDMINVRYPAKLHFKQIALREAQHLIEVPKEQLWSFWESLCTAVIKRQHGAPRIKVIPPVRLPGKLGATKGSKLSRPKTSRLRPATARFIASRDSSNASRNDLAGPLSSFHFIKVSEEITSVLKESIPRECLDLLSKRNMMQVFSLSIYVLMLGKCCRNWSSEEKLANQLRGEADGCSSFFQGSDASVRKLKPEPTIECQKSYTVKDMKQSIFGGKLDLGTFLVGVEISLRDLDSESKGGVFGPLTNDVALRVNLSASETFLHLMIAMEQQLKMVLERGHFPFKTVIEELGIRDGLPVKFSYLDHHSVLQLSNSDAFYFIETAVGVQRQALARLGTACYLQPLNGKLSDTSNFELIIWESCEGGSLGGVLRYHQNTVRKEVVEEFCNEYSRLMSLVAQNPLLHLRTLASQIRSPFLKRKL